MPAPRAVLSATPTGGTLPLGTLLLTEAVGTLPLRTYRRVLYLRFTADGLAEEIAVDAAAVLRASFEPRDYDALHPGAPLQPAVLGPAGETLTVTLDAPRRLLFIQIAPGKAADPGCTLQVHRLDGQAVAEKPTATAQAFEWAFGSFAGGIFGGVPSLTPPSTRTFVFDFTDARFALRLLGPDGKPISLAPADVTAVQILAEPTGARIGIAADPAAPPVLVWPGPGDDAGALGVDAGTALAEALARHLSGLPPPDAEVSVALVITADTPCQIHLSAVEIPYRLVRRSFVSGAEKEVVRFGDGGEADHSAILRLPGRATITSALLQAAPSLRSDRPTDGTAPTGDPTEKDGMRIDGNAWVAQGITPPQALALSGLAVGLLALTAGTELTLELREDYEGEPTGRPLAAGSLTLKEAGRPAWVTLFLKSTVVLPSQPCWLLLTASHGTAVWLARPTTSPLRLLGRLDPQSPGARKASLEGLETLHRLLAEAPVTAGGPPPSLELRLGEAALALTPGEDGRVELDLASALTAALAAAPSGAPQDLPLRFTAAAPGSCTLYPPRIEYEPR